MHPYRDLQLVVVSGALFLDSLDLAAAGVALPTVGRDLSLSLSQLAWVATAYAVGLGGLLLLGGQVVDRYGGRSILLWATALSVVASVLTGLAPNAEVLIAGRLLRGATAAFALPASMSLLGRLYPVAADRDRAVGRYATLGAVGLVLGLLVGGPVANVSWRLAFLVPALVAVLLVGAAPRILPTQPSRSPDRRGVLSASAISVALVAATLGLTTAPSRGWTSSQSLFCFGIAAGAATCFLAAERRSAAPLLPSLMRRRRMLAVALAVAFSYFGTYCTFQFLLTLYLEQSLSWSATATALAFLPSYLVVIAGSAPAGKLVAAVGAAPVMTVGMLALAGAATLPAVVPPSALAAVVLPAMVLSGVGCAAGFPSLTAAALGAVQKSEHGVASGLVSSSMQIGRAVVLGAVTTVAVGTGAGSDPTVADGYRRALLVVAVVAVGGALLAVLGRDGRTSSPPLAPPPVAPARQGIGDPHGGLKEMSTLFDVSGRTVLITGGSRGIGLMIAAGFAAHGARVYLCGRDSGSLAAVAASIGATPIPGDVASEAGCVNLAATFAAHEDTLDVLVNNAGIVAAAPLAEYPASEFEAILSTNVVAPFLLTRELLPLLRRSANPDRPACVIMIGSVDGLSPGAAPNYAYGPSKAAVHLLARQLAVHLASHHITVNALAPGLFLSRMTKDMFGPQGEEPARVVDNIPLGRTGKPDDIAGPAIWLASRAGAYITGAVIPVDGGSRDMPHGWG